MQVGEVSCRIMNPVAGNPNGGGSASTALPAVWKASLEHLKLLMPQATYDTLLADTTGAAGGQGQMEVTVTSPHAKAWIEARLLPMVHHALQRAGYEGSVDFRAPDVTATLSTPNHEPLQSDRLPVPGQSPLEPGSVVLTFLNFDLYARGWLRTPTYYELFWQPVLGHVAYATWRLMQVLYWSNPSGSMTRRVRLDIQDAAAHLGVSRDLVRGKPAAGLGGALQTLSQHGLAQVQRHDAGRATVYSARFLRRLPLLAPGQVAALTPSQQQQHLDWLLSAGHDPQAWESLADRFPSFVLPADSPPPEPAALPFSQPDWESEPLGRTGFLRTPVYYDLFLQPLIGPEAFAVWRVCKCLNAIQADYNRARDTITSVYSLAATLGCHRQKITGVRRSQAGGAYWQDGAFDRLRKHRLALIREEGSGSQVAYRLLVVNEPPMLCPTQVGTFGEKLQSTHAEWLRKAQLQLEEWRQLPMDSLLEVSE
jgi:hypothetical protein